MAGSESISVVVPVYNSVSSLPRLVERVEASLREAAFLEILLVDDGSEAKTWAMIENLARNHPSTKGIRLRRNFGQHSALIAGVRAAAGDLVVTIDDDLQNPPEEIPKLTEALLSNGLDVVYGVPESVEQSVPRKLAGRITRLALGRGLKIASAPDVSSFRAFHTASRDAFDADLGTNVSLDALLSWGNARYGSVSVRHDARAVGKSNYTFRKLLSFALDTTTGYSVVPLQAASVLGIITAGIGFLVLLWVVARPLLSGESVPGFPFLASTVAFFSGVQLLTLGVVGEYLARMHFRIMHKPTYVVRTMTEGPRDLTTRLNDHPESGYSSGN